MLQAEVGWQQSSPGRRASESLGTLMMMEECTNSTVPSVNSGIPLPSSI